MSAIVDEGREDESRTMHRERGFVFGDRKLLRRDYIREEGQEQPSPMDYGLRLVAYGASEETRTIASFPLFSVEGNQRSIAFLSPSFPSIHEGGGGELLVKRKRSRCCDKKNGR